MNQIGKLPSPLTPTPSTAQAPGPQTPSAAAPRAGQAPMDVVQTNGGQSSLAGISPAIAAVVAKTCGKAPIDAAAVGRIDAALGQQKTALQQRLGRSESVGPQGIDEAAGRQMLAGWLAILGQYAVSSKGLAQLGQTLARLPDSLKTTRRRGQYLTQLAGDLGRGGKTLDKSAAEKLQLIAEMGGYTADDKAAVKNLLQRYPFTAAAKKLLGALVKKPAFGDKAQWNFFVFLNGDNNLEPDAINDVNEMEGVGTLPGKVNVVALVDGGHIKNRPDWKTTTRLMFITKDPTNSQTITSREVVVDPDTALGKMMRKNAKELDMGDPATLRAATQYVIKHSPAEHLLVDIWNHGSGWTLDGHKNLGQPVPSLRGISYDDSSGHHISIAKGQLTDALKGLPVNILSADACLMATDEVAVTAQKLGVDQLVTSEQTEPDSGWYYTGVLKRLAALFKEHAEVSPAEVAKAIVVDYGTGGTANSTLSVVDLKKLPAVQKSINDFASALIAAGGLKNSSIHSAYTNALRFDDHDQMDLGDFARRVADAAPSAAVKSAAKEVMQSLKNAAYETTGNPSAYGNAEGLAIYAPTYGFNSSYVNPRAPWKGVLDKWVQLIKN